MKTNLLARQLEEGALARRQVHNIPRSCQLIGNIFSSLDSSQFNQTLSGCTESLSQKYGSLGVTFGRNNSRLLLLFSFFDKEASALGILLSHLLQLDGLGEFFAEGQMCLKKHAI
jgi:hypothetical protein